MPFMSEIDRSHILEIKECCEKIKKFTGKLSSSEAFQNDEIIFDAVLMNFVVIGELSTKISNEFKKSNPHIDWTDIKSFRNVIAHNYFGVDPEEVWQIIQTDLTFFILGLNEIISEF